MKYGITDIKDSFIINLNKIMLNLLYLNPSNIKLLL